MGKKQRRNQRQRGNHHNRGGAAATLDAPPPSAGASTPPPPHHRPTQPLPETHPARRAGPAPASVQSVGLQNLGNTCYFNSVLQALSGTARLASRLKARRAAGESSAAGESPITAAFVRLASSLALDGQGKPNGAAPPPPPPPPLPAPSH